MIDAPAGGAEALDRQDAVGAREVLLEDDGVGDDGHRHAARLRAVFLLQPLGDPRADVGAEFDGVAKVLCGSSHAPFETVGGGVYGVHGDARVVGEAGEVRRAAGEPPGYGEAVVHARGYAVEQRVLDAGAGVAEGGAELFAR